MISRKLGKLLRGQATPFQIVTACALGAMLGFAPEPALAPGLYALLVFALLVANANLGLALLVAAAAKPLSWALAPGSFAVGRLLLDGPTSGAADRVVHAPVLAWCGLERYAVAGGQLVGMCVGLAAGLVLARGVTTFRRRMAAAEEGDSRLMALGQKRWARVLTWILFGKKKGKATYAERAQKKTRLPFRPVGLAAVAVLVGGAFVAQRFLGDEFATDAVSARLGTLNGATVDVERAHLDVLAGAFGVEGLAVADPEDLGRDLFRAKELSADIAQVDLLARRVHVNRLVVSGATTGAPRAVPGVLVERSPRTDDPEPRAPDDPRTEETDAWSLDEVLVEAEAWKTRLAHVDRWLDRLSGDGGSHTTPCGREETDEESVEREKRELGLFAVASPSLAPPAPAFRVSELAIEGLAAGWLPGRTFDLVGSELSSAPWLVDGAPTVSLTSRDGTIGFSVDLAPASRAGGLGGLAVRWTGIDVDSAMDTLRLESDPPLRGGTLDVEVDGRWAEGVIGDLDLPVQVTFRGSTLALPGVEETVLESFVVPIHVTGSLRAPVVHFETRAFTDALVEAARTEAEARLRAEVEARVGAELEGALGALEESTGVDVPDDLDGAVDAALGGKLDGALGGTVDDAKEKASGLLNGLGGFRPKR